MVETVDVLVAGGGVAGLAFAAALRRAAPMARVAVADPAFAAPDGAALGSAAPDGAASGAPRRTLRAVAVAAGSRRFLDGLGAWEAVAAAAQPMVEMAITDSRDRDAPRPVFLDIDGEAEDGEPFAHMVFQDDLRAAVLAAARGAGVRLLPARVSGFRRDGGAALSVDGAPRARLLVAADGGRSRLREAAGIGTVGWDYPQSGVVATIGHEIPHDGRAVQHFLPGGPLAILPMRAADGSERRFSLAWSAPHAEARALVALPPAGFLAALEERIGYGYGALTLEDRPAAYPLRLALPRALVRERFALLGDAARTVHPLAGQGLNLGLRDAAALAESVSEPLGLGLDPADPEALKAYERARRFDAALMAGMTDGLNRLFSNDSAAARVLRDVGLGLVDRLPALKRALVRDASGLSGAVPERFRR